MQTESRCFPLESEDFCTYQPPPPPRRKRALEKTLCFLGVLGTVHVYGLEELKAEKLEVLKCRSGVGFPDCQQHACFSLGGM